MTTPSQPGCCIVYTTDHGYLFPTLVSAMQARRHASPGKAVVTIYCLEMEDHAQEVFGPICAREGIGLVSIPVEMIDGEDAMLARLYLNRFVPEQYTQYLYLDGDTQILDSLDPLIDANVPSGCFLAANDPISFLLNDGSSFSRELGRHIRSLGLTEDQSLRYFNSGVLRIHRDGWDEVGQKAVRYFHDSGTSRRFPDQDALNAVALDHRLPMSLVWNYPVFLRNSRVEHRIRPRIQHFMSRPKPWHGSFPPWTRKDTQPYRDALREDPALVPFYREMPLQDRMVYHFQQHGKRYLETMTWGHSKRRDRVLDYEANCLSCLGSIARA